MASSDGNTNNLLQTLTDSIPENINPRTAASSHSSVSSDSSDSSFFSDNWITIIVIIVGLAFLGFNIFTYLSEGTKTIADITGPVVSFFVKLFGGTALATTKQTVQTSAIGTKGAVDITEGTITGGINAIEQNEEDLQPKTGAQAELQPKVNLSNQNARQYANFNQMAGINSGKRVGQHVSSLEEKEDYLENDSLNKALQNASQTVAGKSSYEADDAYSSVQGAGKAGWCFIGEEKNVRSCVEVGVNDTCMSGDIFPTSDVCINPKLRA
jgi:hypothetical protein